MFSRITQIFTISMFTQTINIKFIKGAIHQVTPFLKRIRRSNSFCSFKVACMVDIKLFFYGLMQNPIQKFRQSSIVFEKPGILFGNLKTVTSCNYPTVQYFFAETSHTFPTYQFQQKCVRDFLNFV